MWVVNLVMIWWIIKPCVDFWVKAANAK